MCYFNLWICHGDQVACMMASYLVWGTIVPHGVWGTIVPHTPNLAIFDRLCSDMRCIANILPKSDSALETIYLMSKLGTKNHVWPRYAQMLRRCTSQVMGYNCTPCESGGGLTTQKYLGCAAMVI